MILPDGRSWVRKRPAGFAAKPARSGLLRTSTADCSSLAASLALRGATKVTTIDCRLVAAYQADMSGSVMSHNHFRRRDVLAAVFVSIAASSQAQQANARTASALIAAARGQVGVTLGYDPTYTRLTFPGGDVDRATGVCTDVLIRAYRDAFGLDLQALVNADMRAAFPAYPKSWGLIHPDRNIDHRRVPNLQTFLARVGAKQTMPSAASAWKPGDIFTALIDNRLPHIGIVSDRVNIGAPPDPEFPRSGVSRPPQDV
jgi:uncharacterized protein YijF (DUF1287 family)